MYTPRKKSGDLGGHSLSLKRITTLFWKTWLTLCITIIIWCAGTLRCAHHSLWNCTSWNWCGNNITSKITISIFVTSKFDFTITLPSKTKVPSTWLLPHNPADTVTFWWAFCHSQSNEAVLSMIPYSQMFQVLTLPFNAKPASSPTINFLKKSGFSNC